MLPVCMMVMMLYLQCGRLCNALHIAQMHHLQVEYGELVTLPCNASAYLEEEEGGPWWEAMGEDVAILQGEEVIQADRFNGRFHLPSEELRREGHWSLVLSYALLSDTNMYECIWQGKKTISTVWLTVNLPHVERSMSVPSVPSMDDYRRRIFPDSRESFELDISPTMMTDSGEYQCLYKTSDADDARPGTPESITLTVVETNTTDIAAPDNVPWVRYGLIAAVLLLTAVVLCILKAAQRI
ncbi:hypothetical protein F7725_009171 [Dissostichus mawsoni]|uniref:Ig-like domain-containing protein n=1 Tax=Dissostichus mawsoni TaxID=36200 RepID=A0A7J5Z678_DISMA|nr:hypothetical protein F7725_009171 [Dissostichus mawsoni]